MAPAAAAAAAAAAANCCYTDESRPTSSSSSSTRVVCVMEASGHLGSALVQHLLLRGYTVHAALLNNRKLRCVEGLNCKNKKLKVFDVEPFDYQSILEALKGCCGLFYSFEPTSAHSNYDETMAEVEARAAHNVLEACAQTRTIHKVVFTSSITAVIWSNALNTTTFSHIDERNWSDINFCKEFKLWHGLSKTVAEKAAWALAMDRGLSMVSINGGLLMSPDLTITDSYLKGAAEMYEEGVFVTVDLTFFVDAHICVFEDASSYGRYLCFNHVINCNEDAMKLSHMLLPPTDSSPPQRCSSESTRVYQQRISNKKLNKLMVNLEEGDLASA